MYAIFLQISLMKLTRRFQSYFHLSIFHDTDCAFLILWAQIFVKRM
jgi:hypothetical protein